MLSQNPKYRKTVQIIGITIAVFAVAMVALRLKSDDEARKTASRAASSTPMEQTLPTRMIMSGTYVDCLPLHDNFSEKVCIAGLKTDDGTYYAVDFSLMSQEHRALKNGEKFTANGVVTPIEMLSANQWREVVGRGVFSVTDSLEIK